MAQDKSIIKLLLKNGAHTEQTNSNGVTPLILSSRFYPEGVKPLLKYKAAINSITHQGATALSFAAKYCNRKIVKLLIRKGAQVNIPANNNITALTIAIAYNRNDNLEELLQNNAQANNNKEIEIIQTALLYNNSALDLLRKYNFNVPLILKADH